MQAAMRRVSAMVLALAMLLVASPGKAGQGGILETAAAKGQFGMLLEAIRAAGLEAALRGPGPFTLFAPADFAFASLPEGKLEALLASENREELRALLAHHVVSGAWTGRQLAGRTKTLEGLDGSEIRVKDTGRIVRIDEAALLVPDIAAANGIIHVIDMVMMPAG